ncbi:hypothetical protein NPA07_04280 [Mycoplasmopsis caviae]|uniref:Uncharacterized protein n=1 Tax=Mycoplasmopsis caviae TaxID=55603 RepID=A0ABY5J156_9BACT|nr:hypothetical protein [Mycoplasmopsis caviae]UUD34998.1 hypothetical protein NPA07_04280 [Mycoplasmopsis caviae]
MKKISYTLVYEVFIFIFGSSNLRDNENKTKQTKLLCPLEIKEVKTPWFKMV